MALFRLLIGFFVFLLGWGYLFYPNLILRLNEFVRENLFKDSTVILSHRRIGIVLMLLGFIFLVIAIKTYG